MNRADLEMERRATNSQARSVGRRRMCEERNAKLMRRRLALLVPFLGGVALLGWYVTREIPWQHSWALIVGIVLVMPMLVTWEWKL